jgi:hypothetical protein
VERRDAFWACFEIAWRLIASLALLTFLTMVAMLLNLN